MHAIVCIGDSIVFGRGELPNNGWVGRLKEYHEKQDNLNWIYSLGISGDTSEKIFGRIDTELKYRKPIGINEKFSVIIGGGTNDTKASEKNGKVQIPISRFRKNIREIIKISRKYAHNLIFLGLLPVDEDKTTPIEGDKFYYNERLEEYNDVLKDICKKEKVLFIEFFPFWIKLDYKILFIDGIHPNSKGYDLMFKDIKSRLLKERIIE